MTGQTIIQYNGVTIFGCVTRRFDQESVYDDSDTDLLYEKFTVVVSGTVHGVSAQTTTGMTPVSSGSASRHFNSVNYLLAQPRKSFLMATGADSNGENGVTLLECEAFAANGSDAKTTISHRDVNNGPITRNIRIKKITADQLFFVDVEFEICMRVCDSSGSVSNSINSVLSNRWSSQDEIDKNQTTTRTFTGRLRVANSRLNAHDFRYLVLPPLASGMRRDKMRFLVTEDGLNLEYTITDKEVHYAPPEPATSWSYSHTEHSGTGMHWYGEVSIRLEGDRNVNKKKLIQIAAQIILQRSNLGIQRANPANILELMSITDEYGDNVSAVSAYARFREATAPGIRGMINTESLGRPINANDLAGIVASYDRNISRGHVRRGGLKVSGPVDLIGAVTAHLRDPCSPGSQSIVDGVKVQPSRSPRTGDGGGVVEGEIVDELPDEEPDYLSESHKDAMYEHWSFQSTYHDDQGNVQLPFTNSPSSSDATSVVVALHFPVGQRTVRATGTRTGQSPVFPKAQNYHDSVTGIDAILLHAKLLASTSERTPDGQEMFRSDIEYKYALSRPPRSNERLPIGINPWDKLGLQRTTTTLLSGSEL